MVMKVRLLINLNIFIRSVFRMLYFYEILNQPGFTITRFAKNQLICIGASFHLVALEPQKKILSKRSSVISSLAQSLLQQILLLLLQLAKCNSSVTRNKSTIMILNTIGRIIDQCGIPENKVLLNELIVLNEELVLVLGFQRKS